MNSMAVYTIYLLAVIYVLSSNCESKFPISTAMYSTCVVRHLGDHPRCSAVLQSLPLIVRRDGGPRRETSWYDLTSFELVGEQRLGTCRPHVSLATKPEKRTLSIDEKNNGFDSTAGVQHKALQTWTWLHFLKPNRTQPSIRETNTA